MQMRRVVTGHSPEGKSVVASDTLVDATEVALPPALTYCQLWGSDQTPSFPDDGAKPGYHTFFPPVAGFRFSHHTIPPDASLVVPDMSNRSPAEVEAAVAAAEAKRPGLAATMEPGDPGFHRSDSIDLIYILSGEIDLELDDGETVTLRAGDALIQNGTRHAWHNRGSQPCTWVAVLIGAQRQG